MTATKRLLLLRHAKSSWDDPSLDDHDRPLAPRGRAAAKLIADHLRQARIRPSIVLCSSARRTQETLAELGLDCDVQIEPALYGASAGGLIERLRALPESVDSPMLIGHNPAIQSLTVTLAAGGAELARARQKFPTAALATLAIAGTWSELAPGRAELEAFVTPKGLQFD